MIRSTIPRALPLLALLIAVLVVVASHSAFAGDAPAAPSAQSTFDRLKALEGTWVGTAGFGEEKSPTTVTYKLTGAGSVVMETLFGGTNEEMVTMYHVDRDRLMLTHYCAGQNQPRMRAIPTADPNTIRFVYLDATNLASARDAHMHAAAITFINTDHIQSAWTAYADGKPAHEARFDLTRSKH